MAGRVKRDAAGVEVETTAGAERGADRPLRPAQCRAYMRKTLAREFRGIVQGFVDGAKSGSCQHVKLATELLAPPPKQRARKGKGKASVRRMLEELDRD